MRFMNLQYVKRYRMELDLRRWRQPCAWSCSPSQSHSKNSQSLRIELPVDYRLLTWHPALVQAHAEVKYASFRGEIDALLFPCLGELEGCERLMSEIEARDGFLPEGTWLAESMGVVGSMGVAGSASEYCGTIQAIRTHKDKANIQNIGVAPYHRGRGIGTALILASLLGLHHLGIRKVGLEVTAENEGAVRLYRQLGFRTARTLYKGVDHNTLELAYSETAR